MSRVTCWLFLAVVLATNAGTAQAPAPPVVGERVRVAYRCHVVPDRAPGCRERDPARMATGRLEGLDGNSLRIRAEPHQEELVIPTASLAELWVVQGTRGHARTGAGLGLMGGALLGGIIGSTQEFCTFSCSPATAIGILVGAPAGLLLGAVVGAALRSDRWRSVSIKDRRIQVEPRLGGIGLRVSVSF